MVGPISESFSQQKRPAARRDNDLERVAIAWAIRNRTALDTRESAARGLVREALDEFDPTRGATRFHRHDEAPEWARHRLPVALIGRYLFYVD